MLPCGTGMLPYGTGMLPCGTGMLPCGSLLLARSAEAMQMKYLTQGYKILIQSRIELLYIFLRYFIATCCWHFVVNFNFDLLLIVLFIL